MGKDPLVVARFKDDGSEPPRFTKSCTPKELIAAIMKDIPVEGVYFILPHEDGLGYSLRAAGRIVLDIEPIPELRDSVSEPEPVLPTPVVPEPKKRKAKKAVDGEGPGVVSSGVVKITNVIPATPEQAAAASHIGEVY